jgi:hypothetical protein
MGSKMTIRDAHDTLKRQILLGRTPKGRRLTKKAILTIDAALADEKNMENEVVQCQGCGFVGSILLVEDGCANCGIVDLTTKITENDEWNYQNKSS